MLNDYSNEGLAIINDVIKKINLHYVSGCWRLLDKDFKNILEIDCKQSCFYLSRTRTLSPGLIDKAKSQSKN